MELGSSRIGWFITFVLRNGKFLLSSSVIKMGGIKIARLKKKFNKFRLDLRKLADSPEFGSLQFQNFTFHIQFGCACVKIAGTKIQNQRVNESSSFNIIDHRLMCRYKIHLYVEQSAAAAAISCCCFYFHCYFFRAFVSFIVHFQHIQVNNWWYVCGTVCL